MLASICRCLLVSTGSVRLGTPNPIIGAPSAQQMHGRTRVLHTGRAVCLSPSVYRPGTKQSGAAHFAPGRELSGYHRSVGTVSAAAGRCFCQPSDRRAKLGSGGSGRRWVYWAATGGDRW